MLTRSSVRLLVAGAVLVAVVAVAAVASEGSRSIRVRDDCDPATFNAAVGAGTCQTTFDGDTTFQKFINEVTEDKSVGAWRFNPDRTDLDRGQKTILESRGGEFHTFTQVAEFGGGVVPVLNDLSGAGATRRECLVPPDNLTSFGVPSGAAFMGPKAGTKQLPPGTTKWQCCIHPWMRSTITVK